MIFVEPLTYLIVDGKSIKGKKVSGKYFGGFCSCEGIMFQKVWFTEKGRKGKYIIISECEKCWKNEAMIFDDEAKLIDRIEVEVIDRSKIPEFLKNILSESEFKAIKNKARGKEYSYTAFSKAKKKIEEFGIDTNELLKFLF